MPAFLFLSGFLISHTKLQTQSIFKVLGSRTTRLIVPWVVASLLFLAIYNSKIFTSGIGYFLRKFLFTPYFHLWYIPAVLVQLCLLWLLLRFGRSAPIIAAVFALLTFVLFEFYQSPLYNPFFDRRYLGYFVFFVLGYFFRNYDFKTLNGWFVFAGILASAALYIYSFQLDPTMQFVSFVIFSGFSCLAIPALIKWLSGSSNWFSGVLAQVGRGSLWLYLAHPLITNYLRMPAKAGLIDYALALLLAFALAFGFGLLYGLLGKARPNR
jgi:peptidoglycan/LPS O-acetylase OafA/YrhL